METAAHGAQRAGLNPAEAGFKGVALSPHLQITSPEMAIP